MQFNTHKLNVYKELLATTELQQGYQEFIRLFRYLKIQLEKELGDFSFSNGIIENRMDFAYFQLFDNVLKQKGLKIQVVFVHKEYQFEVWISGYNRKIQCAYYNYLKDKNIEYIINDNPNRVDYIIKVQLDKECDISNSDMLIGVLSAEIERMVEFVKGMNIE